MSQQSPTPYDTGERCEPKSWIPYGTPVSAATPTQNFGKVDFEDDEGHTVCVVHVESDEHGRHIAVVELLCEDDELEVRVLRRKDSLRIGHEGVSQQGHDIQVDAQDTP